MATNREILFTLKMRNQARNTLRQVGTSFRNVAKSATRAAASIRRVTASALTAATSIGKVGRATDALARSPGPNALAASLTRVGVVAKSVGLQIASIGALAGTAAGSLATGFAAGAKDARTSLKQLSGRNAGLGQLTTGIAGATGAMRGLGSATSSTFAAFAGGTAIVGTFLAGIKTISDFERRLSTVGAIASATDEEFRQLSETAQRLGATTEFTATQAAEALEFLARTGQSVQQATQSLPAVLDLATAGGIQLGRSADIVASQLGAFNLSAERAGDVTDILSLVTAKTKTNLLQLGQAMTFAGPAAATFGVSLNEAASAVGVLGDAGITASIAGTRVRQALARITQLATGTATRSAQEAFENLKIDPRNIDPRRVGLTGAIKAFKEAGTSAEDLFAIFDVRTAGPVQLLIDRFTKLNGLVGETGEALGETGRQAKLIRDNLRGDFDTLVSSIQAAFIRLGELGGGNLLRGVTQFATQFVRELVGLPNTVDKVSAAVKRTVQVVKGLGTVLGAFLGFKIFTAGIGLIIKTLIALSSPIRLVLALFGQLGAAVAFLSIRLAGLSLSAAGASIVGLGGAFKSLTTAIVSATVATVKFGAALITLSLSGIVTGLRQAAIAARTFTTALAVGSLTPIRAALLGVVLNLNSVRLALGRISFVGAIAGAKAFAASMLTVSRAGIVAAFRGIGGSLKAIGGALKGISFAALSTAASVAAGVVAVALTAIVAGIFVLKDEVAEVDGEFASLGNRARASLKGVKEAFAPLGLSLANLGAEILGVDKSWESFSEFADDAFKATIDFLGEFIKGFTAGVILLINIFKRFPEFMDAVFNRAIRGLKEDWNDFVSFFELGIRGLQRLFGGTGEGAFGTLDFLRFDEQRKAAKDAIDQIFEDTKNMIAKINREARDLQIAEEFKETADEIRARLRDISTARENAIRFSGQGGTLINEREIEGGIKLTEEQKRAIEDFNDSFKDRLTLLRTEIALQNVVGRERELANDLAEIAIEAQEAGIKDILPLLNQYADLWRQVKELQEGTIGAVRGARAAVVNFIDDATDSFENFQRLTGNVLDSLSDRFADFLTGGKLGFKEFIDQMINDFTRFTTRFVFAKLLENAGFSQQNVSGAGILGALAGGSTGATVAPTGRAGDALHVIVDNIGSTLDTATVAAASGALRGTGTDGGVAAATSDTALREFRNNVTDASAAANDFANSTSRAAETPTEAFNRTSGIDVSAQIGSLDALARSAQEAADRITFDDSSRTIADASQGVVRTFQNIEAQFSREFANLAKSTAEGVTVQPLVDSPSFQDAQRSFGDRFGEAANSFTQRASEVFARAKSNISQVFENGAFGSGSQQEVQTRAKQIYDRILPTEGLPDPVPEILRRRQKILDFVAPETLPGGVPSIGEGATPFLAAGDIEGYNNAIRQAAARAQEGAEVARGIPEATRSITQSAREGAIAANGISQAEADALNSHRQAATTATQSPVEAERAVRAIQETANRVEPAPAAAEEFTQNVRKTADNARAAASNSVQIPTFISDIGQTVSQQGQTAARSFGTGLGTGLGTTGGGGIIGIISSVAGQLGGQLGGIVGQIVGIFQQIFSSLSTLASGSGGGFGGILSSFFHDGGVVGHTNAASKFVRSSAFRHAKKYHRGKGLKDDEIPAILQRGEIVLSRKQVQQLMDDTSRRGSQTQRFGSAADIVNSGRRSSTESHQQAVLSGRGAPGGGGAMVQPIINVKQTIVAPDPNRFRQSLGQQATQTKQAMDKAFVRNS